MPLTSQASFYLQAPTRLREHALLNPNTKWIFVGVDMAPNETLESGLVALDRHRRMTRIDKLYSDSNIIQAISSLGPAENILVCLDMPKNLEVPGKFRHEEIKWNAFRLNRQHLNPAVTDRFSNRARKLADALQEQGLGAMLLFSYNAKMAFNLTIPFKSRSPQGCRAMQNLIQEVLELRDMPSNLAPSSVLDAMVCAYCGWLTFSGQEGKHYQLFTDDENRVLIEARQPIPASARLS